MTAAGAVAMLAASLYVLLTGAADGNGYGILVGATLTVGAATLFCVGWNPPAARLSTEE